MHVPDLLLHLSGLQEGVIGVWTELLELFFLFPLLFFLVVRSGFVDLRFSGGLLFEWVGGWVGGWVGWSPSSSSFSPWRGWVGGWVGRAYHFCLEGLDFSQGGLQLGFKGGEGGLSGGEIGCFLCEFIFLLVVCQHAEVAFVFLLLQGFNFLPPLGHPVFCFSEAVLGLS